MESRKAKTYLRITVCIAAALVFGFASLWLPSAQVDAQSTPRKGRYSEFQHTTKAHRANCATCHKFPSANWKKVRSPEAAFPDITEYPSHSSCIKCHTQQFFRGARPAICAICHTNPGPRSGARHPFPNPREVFDKSAKGKTAQSDFVVGFPHDKHVDIVTAHARPMPAFINASLAVVERRQASEDSCAVCHQTLQPQGDSDDEYVTKPPATLGDGFWVKKGMFKTAPIGHKTCFTCHSADSGMLPEPNNCSACHQLKPPQPPADIDLKFLASTGITDKIMIDAWRNRDSSGTYRHEFFAHAELSCSTCHNVSTINAADPLTKKVSMAACAACHATPSSDDGGALNYEVDKRKEDPAFQCVKCHVTFGKLPVPPTHTKALSEATGK